MGPAIRTAATGGIVLSILNQPQTIGQSVSSGCFRLVNPDVIDLFDRVPVGSKVIVHQAPDT